MDKSFSPMIFVDGLAFVLGVGKACTLLIWRTLPRPQSGLRQEVREAWQRWTQRKFAQDVAGHSPGDPGPTGFDPRTSSSGRAASALTCPIQRLAA